MPDWLDLRSTLELGVSFFFGRIWVGVESIERDSTMEDCDWLITDSLISGDSICLLDGVWLVVLFLIVGLLTDWVLLDSSSSRSLVTLDMTGVVLGILIPDFLDGLDLLWMAGVFLDLL